jgi:hypothetical protein
VKEDKAKTRIPGEAEKVANRILYGTPEGAGATVDGDKDPQDPAE